VFESLGINVDVSILEANDFLIAQIGILMKILADNEVEGTKVATTCIAVPDMNSQVKRVIKT
jgi:hypothetical protein